METSVKRMATDREPKGFPPATDIDTGVIPIRTSGRGMKLAVDGIRDRDL